MERNENSGRYNVSSFLRRNYLLNVCNVYTKHETKYIFYNVLKMVFGFVLLINFPLLRKIQCKKFAIK